MRKELAKVKIPTREFTFAARIWMPSRWIVRRHLYGVNEVIPTIITKTPAGVATGRQDADQVDGILQDPILKNNALYLQNFWVCSILCLSANVFCAKAQAFQVNHKISILAMAQLYQTNMGLDSEHYFLARGKYLKIFMSFKSIVLAS